MMKRLKKTVSLTLVLLLAITLMGPTASLAYEEGIDLNTAYSFSVLAGETITNTGPTVIEGDVGLHPGTEFTGEDQAVIGGDVEIDNAVALQAKDDLVEAYNDAAGRTSETTDEELGGKTLTPGVYSSETSLQITGTLVLDGEGNPDSVFIFQAGSTLTTATDSRIELINGATCENVFWQVGSSAILGTNSEFIGTILALTSITANTGAEIEGRLLARNGAVSLASNTISMCTEDPDATPDTGYLTVTKTVSGDTGDMTLPPFEITVTGPDDFSETRTFTDGESYTWEDLVPGEYTVTESRTDLNDQWTVEGEGTVEVSADLHSEVTITNTYSEEPDATPETGSLTVTNEVTGDTEDITLPPFEITVTGPDGFTETRTLTEGESYTWEDLVPGEYNITADHSLLGSGWTVSGEGAVQVAADDTETATITFHYEARAEIPQTGQASNYSMIILLVTAVAIIAGTFPGIKRKKQRE